MILLALIAAYVSAMLVVAVCLNVFWPGNRPSPLCEEHARVWTEFDDALAGFLATVNDYVEGRSSDLEADTCAALDRARAAVDEHRNKHGCELRIDTTNSAVKHTPVA
jgi:hypothetical protein